MNEHILDYLDDYLDDSLPAADRIRVENHLTGCEPCRRDLERLRNLLSRTKSLPGSLKPERDLWPGIESRLGDSKTERPAYRTTLSRTGLGAVMRYGAAAAAVITIVVGTWWLLQPRDGWNFAVVEGTASLESETVSGEHRMIVGDLLETGNNGRARIQVGIIGHVEVAPNTNIRLVEATMSNHRLALDKGTIEATIFAPPRLFFVETPSALAVDLGCAYTLTVDGEGSGSILVTSGWVALEYGGRESIVPAGAACNTRTGFGPGTPYQQDASIALVESLTDYDFAAGGATSLRKVLSECRPMDSITLWHLYLRTSADQRAAVYDRMASLIPPPSGVTRDGMLKGDPDMMKRWRKYLNLGMDSWWKVL